RKEQIFIRKWIEIIALYLAGDAHRVAWITNETNQGTRGFKLGKQALGSTLEYVGLVERTMNTDDKAVHQGFIARGLFHTIVHFFEIFDDDGALQIGG